VYSFEEYFNQLHEHKSDNNLKLEEWAIFNNKSRFRNISQRLQWRGRGECDIKIPKIDSIFNILMTAFKKGRECSNRVGQIHQFIEPVSSLIVS